MFMRATMKIGNTEAEHESALKTMKCVFQILDRLQKLKMSESFKRKANIARKANDTEKAKQENEKEEQEMLEKKRREQIESNEKLKTLPPE